MNTVDQELVYEALKAHQGSSPEQIAKSISISRSTVNDRMRALKGEGRVVSLRRGNVSGCYTMDYYNANKESLDEKYKSRTSGQGHSGEKAMVREESNWTARIARLNQLMPAPSR